MEITDLAERLLFAETLEDKLFRPPTVEDERPKKACKRPKWPGRPAELRLDLPATSFKFPGLTADAGPRTRGHILHFFANHELLAIELMALFLLRYPKAPARFRAAVVQTIFEEQDHMALYRNRMAQFGVQFGEVPVSSFFWDCLADMSGPLDYLTGLSLTLEQANLDYAAHYYARFHSMGDDDTAAVMRRIYEDEIGHVKLGVTWLERLRDRDDTRSLWDFYRMSLPSPLTPARARGPVFDREGRIAAGLDQHFIDEVSVYAHSKGKPPAIHLYNPLAEESFVDLHRATQPKQAIVEMVNDFQTLPMFVCSGDDLVLVSEQPRTAFLATLKDAGFVLPQFFSRPIEELKERRLGPASPWAWSPDSAKRLDLLRDHVSPPITREPERRLFDKCWSIDLARDLAERTQEPWLAPPDVIGNACVTTTAAKSAVETILEGAQSAVIKAPLATAGRGLVLVKGDKDWARTERWIDKTIATQGAVVVEPWLDNVLDFSIQFTLREGGVTAINGVTRFLTDGRGQYTGTVLGRTLDDLDRDLVRFIVGPGSGPWRVITQLQSVARLVGKALAGLGHVGPAGIDAMVYRDRDGHFRLKPIVEINPRCTMGHIALGVKPRIAHGRTGLLSVVSIKSAQRCGYATLSEYARDLPEPVLDDGLKRGMTSGVLLLTDPGRARQALLLLAVDTDLPALNDR